MIRYYKEVGAIGEDKTEDDIIADMKPWYDNYCFAKDSFGVEPVCSTATWFATI